MRIPKTNFPGNSNGNQRGESFWKLNSRILNDKNFHANFVKILNELLNEVEDYDVYSAWFEESFKAGMRDFLINFSQYRQKMRQDTRSFLMYCLQIAGREEDTEKISFLKSRLKKMNMEYSMGVIIRSRFMESVEKKKLSLYHLNWEVK